MNLINLVEIDTIHGFKAVELYHGDLTNLNIEVDLLVVSAFKNDYGPTKGSLIGNLLDRRGISVQQLSVQPSIDLSQSLGVWMSGPLKGQPYKRLACIEMIDSKKSGDNIGPSITYLFSLINIGEMQDIFLKSIAMPLIGSGQQGIAPEKILDVLMPISLKALNTIPRLQKIIFVEHSKEKVKILDDAMNQYLARKESDVQGIPENNLTNAIRQDLLANFKKLKASLMQDHTFDLETIDELIFKLRGSSLRFFELGLLARRFCEMLVKDILEVTSLKDPLYIAIDLIKEKKKISSWIVSYLHTLRIFGNVAAHEKGQKDYVPSQIHQQDFITVLFCLNRVVDFWVWYRYKTLDSK